MSLFDNLYRNISSSDSDGGRTCVKCGQSLRGGIYTAPWEDDDNPDGYIECPYCGTRNYEWDD